MKTRIAIFVLLVAALLTACCKPDHKQKEEGRPEMDGTYAYVATSESGYQDLFISCGTAVNISSTWKISSPSCPDFAPDGRTVYFQGKEEGRWGIYSYDVTTGKLPVCLTTGLKTDCQYPEVSPDGARLVFTKGGQIATMDLTTKKVETLTFDYSAAATHPTFSEDGKNIVYASSTSGKGQLFDLETETLSTRTLSFGEASMSDPEQCGGTLVYVTRQGICSEGRTLLPGGSAPSAAFGNWVMFIKAGSAYVGNVATGENYQVIDRVAEVAYNENKTVVAAPEDGGKVIVDDADVITSDTELPTLKGRLVYHNYTSYDDFDSKMYLYDFAADKLEEISKGWTTVYHAMNAHFSPDGKYITFMGIGNATDSWDIFLYELGSATQPVNLTPTGSYRDEDPKFSFDGTRICFKRNDRLSEIRVSSKSITALAKDNESRGMPFYTVDGSGIIFSGGNDPNSYIGLFDISSGTSKVLCDVKNVVEYYPITIDEKSFYYTQHFSPTDNHDQLYKGFFDGTASRSLAFNERRGDYSDAYPISDGWLFLVSTRSGTKGGYDLYIANETSGAIFPLSNYNKAINTSKNELGPAYTTAR